MEDKEKKGSYKKKGSAKESDAQEVKNLENDMPVDEVAGAGKGKKHPKKDHKKVAARKKGGAKKDVMMDENMSGSGRKKGSAKKKGSADYSFDKGSHDHPHDGAGRMGFTQNFGAARQNSYAQGAAKVASIMSFGASKKKGAADKQEKTHVHAPTLGSSNLSLSSNIKPPSPMPDFSAGLNQKVQKAPTLTGNSYAGHSSVSDIVNTQESNRDYSSPSAMNLKDNQISRNSQFHYDTGNTGKMTPEISASYDKFLGEGTYISSKDMQKTNKNVNLNNPIYKSNQKAQLAYSEGRVYNNKYGF